MTTALELQTDASLAMLETAITPERLSDALKLAVSRIPRLLTPRADEIIQTTAVIKQVKSDCDRELAMNYAGHLQAEKKLVLAHYEPLKKPFHAAHKAVCELEKETLAPIDREIGRLKDLMAEHDAEAGGDTKPIYELLSLDALIEAAAANPQLRKLLQVDAKAMAARLEVLGPEVFCASTPGMGLKEVGKRPVVRAEKI